jgi:hypothetical protein
MNICDPVIDPTDDMPLDFGAHRGMTPRQLLDADPSYVVWVYENIHGVVTRGTYLDACFILDEDHDRRYLEEEREDEDDFRGDHA